MSGYQPGVCNIDRGGRRQRAAYGAAGFAAAALYLLANVAGVLSDPLLPGVFVPLALGYEWALQAYASFCVRLALANRYDVDGDGVVTDAEAQRADRVQAARITAAAVALAALTTAAVLALAL